jgi:hypothetical protein
MSSYIDMQLLGWLQCSVVDLQLWVTFDNALYPFKFLEAFKNLFAAFCTSAILAPKEGFSHIHGHGIGMVQNAIDHKSVCRHSSVVRLLQQGQSAVMATTPGGCIFYAPGLETASWQ